MNVRVDFEWDYRGTKIEAERAVVFENDGSLQATSNEIHLSAAHGKSIFSMQKTETEETKRRP